MMIRTSRGFRTIVATLALAGVASPVLAQTPAPAAPDKRRLDMKVMEGALVGAVRHGAEVLGAQLKPYNPNLMLLTGTARARGFLLDGYGAFFDVEIPALRESVVWSIRTMALPDPLVAQWLANFRRNVASIPDAAARARLEQSIAQMEQQLRAGSEPPVAQRAGGAAAAQAVSETSVAPEPQSAPSVPPVVQDPNALYTETVKNALIDAMLDYSGPMAIGAEEWLTVAARDAEGPLNPGEPYDAVTIVIRIKGSDLAAFRAERITREEARKRVDVREF
jgi:hypothetical protein